MSNGESSGDRGAWIWFAATAGVFALALRGEFLNWDDMEWITANPWVVTPDRRAWLDIWTTADLGSYYPLYFSALRILWGIGGLLQGWIGENAGLAAVWDDLGGRAMPFHTFNILAFAGACALWHEVLRRLGLGSTARAMAVAFFALHPLRAESVAWASALRDDLSLLMVVTALWLHLSDREDHRRWFAPLAFAAALLTKSMVFALAPAPLLIDLLWRRRSWGEAWPGSIPYLVLGLAGAAIAYLAFQPIAVQNLYPAGDLVGSLPVIGATQLRYLGLQVWPVGLAALPATPAPGVVGWLGLGIGAAALAGAGALAARGRRGPLLVALLYLLPMGPVSGLLPLAWPVADRYTLLPSLAVSLAAGWLVGHGWERLREPVAGWCARGALPLTGIVAAVLALATLQTLPHWRDSRALWERSLSIYPREWAAHLNYAGVLGGDLELDEAAFHLRVAQGLEPRREVDRQQIAGLLLFAELLRAGMPEPVIAEYGTRYQDGIEDGRALSGLALELAAAGLAEPAVVVLRRAEEIGAPPAAPYLVRGTLAGREDRWARSLWLAERGLEAVPDDPNLLTLECMALLKLKQSEAALGVAARLAAMMPGTDPVDILREIAGVGARRPNMRRPPATGP